MPYTNNLWKTILPNLRIMFQFYGPGGIQLGIGWYIIIALVFASAYMMVRKRK